MSGYNKKFLLYDTFNTSNKPLTQKQKTKLLDTIKNRMDDDGHEKIYALIKHHYYASLKADDNVIDNPYNSKEIGTSLIYDIEELPQQLLIIINNFVKKHSEKLESDMNRESMEEI